MHSASSPSGLCIDGGSHGGGKDIFCREREQVMELKLVVVGGKQEGMEIPVQGPAFLIGRGEECRLRPQSTLVSRKHCAIVLDKDSAVLVDYGSVNGTLVNGERVQERQELKNGDRIKIGMLELDVRTAVSLVGKKKPKVNNVQEAAARTVGAARGAGAFGIRSWGVGG